MRKEDVFLTYKMLVQMKDLSDKLDSALKKEDFAQASQIKQKLMEIQRSLAKIL